MCVNTAIEAETFMFFISFHPLNIEQFIGIHIVSLIGISIKYYSNTKTDITTALEHFYMTIHQRSALILCSLHMKSTDFTSTVSSDIETTRVRLG